MLHLGSGRSRLLDLIIINNKAEIKATLSQLQLSHGHCTNTGRKHESAIRKL